MPGLFPGSDAIPSSIFYAGEVLRIVRRNDEALERYRDVTLKYPGSVWAARALVSSALCLVQSGRPITAMEGLQRVRATLSASPEAATALSWNTILYRLYVRAPAQAAYAYSGRMLGTPTAKFNDVSAVAIDARDQVLLAHKDSIAVFDPKGALVRSVSAPNAHGVAFTSAGVPVVVREAMLVPEGGAPMAMGIPQPDGKAKAIEEIPTAVLAPTGIWFVADRKAKAIQMFSSAGKFQKAFVATPVDRFAMNNLMDVAVLDRDAKGVTVYDLNAKVVGRIPTRGAGYELENPVDLAFDAMGHLYVLDRSKATVFVFGPQLKLVTSFTLPEKSPGSFHRAVAFAVDSAARLYIFDDRAQHVQLYQ